MTSPPLVPTQMARDAAADFELARLGYATPYQREIRQGHWDHHTVVQHFASFEASTRQQAIGEAARVARERGEQYVEPTQSDYDKRDGCYDAAEAIEALSPSPIPANLEERARELLAAARIVHQYRLVAVNACGSDDEAVRSAERTFDRLHDAVKALGSER